MSNHVNQPLREAEPLFAAKQSASAPDDTTEKFQRLRELFGFDEHVLSVALVEFATDLVANQTADLVRIGGNVARTLRQEVAAVEKRLSECDQAALEELRRSLAAAQQELKTARATITRFTRNMTSAERHMNQLVAAARAAEEERDALRAELAELQSSRQSIQEAAVGEEDES